MAEASSALNVGSGAVTGDGASTNGQNRPPLVIPPLTPDTTILLQVLHNFEARSPDELTLRKGEHVELLEKDDEFGDGWYLGRSLATNERGLFPQVYTTPVVTTTMFQSPATITPLSLAPSSAPGSISTATTTPIAVQTSSTYLPDPPRPSSPADSHISSSHTIDEPHGQDLQPLAVEKVGTGGTTPTPGTPGEKPINPVGINTEHKQVNYSQSMRSPVVEDTLSDIDEAITEISNSQQHRASRTSNRRHSSMQSTVPARALTPAEEIVEDSSSEYSRQEDIESNSNSEFEDDEEDEVDDSVFQAHGDPANHEHIHSEAVIKTWTPYQVSQYLQSRNIPLVTCQKFEVEEVTGATLLQLEMSHLKELDIGSFGKRFEVWKEIENLVKKAKTAIPVKRSGSDARMSTSSYTKENSARQRSSTVTGGTVLPRIPSQHNRAASRQHHINVHDANLLDVNVPGHGPLHTPMTSTTILTNASTPPFAGVFEAPRSPPISPQRAADTTGNYRRASGTRRLSSQELPATALNAALSASAAVLSAGGTDGGSHQRVGSFDRNWSIPSLGGVRPNTGPRTPENGHKLSTSVGTGDTVFTSDSGFSGSQTHAPKVTERSYFSSGESTPRERKVLQKKNGGNHARKGSYTEEQRLRSATAHSRQSRIGSAGSAIETSRKPSPIFTAAQAYHTRANSKDKKRASTSFSGAPEGFPYDAPRLSPSPSNKAINPQKRTGDESIIGFALSPTTPPPLPNSRSLSEQLTPHGDSSLGGRSFNSLDGSTPSISATVESDPLCATPGTPERPPKADRTMSTGRRIRGVSSGTALRTKSKKHHTSAWEKGLREVTPQEAAEAADYSGWMKKRGSSGIGVWKPRFFVLQGRRLSYFYSERDTKERGLIDITSHRVLPATEDRLVALHASFAAATSPSASPAISTAGSPQTPTADTNGQKSPSSPPPPKEKGKDIEKDKGWFTFKLVPPAPGATKGVTFTPPKLHYFATNTRDEGKKWMGAIMKATIDRDESKPVISSYSAKTISLAKARELRARPPDLLKEGEDPDSLSELLSAGLAISGVDLGVAEGQEGEEAEEADVEDGRDELLEGTESGVGKTDSINSSTPSQEAGDLTEGQNGEMQERSTSSLLKSNGMVVANLGIVT